MPGIFDLFRLTAASRKMSRETIEPDPFPYREPEEVMETAEERVLIEHERAAKTAADRAGPMWAAAFKCFDEMWAENDGRVVPVGPGREVYHAGVIRSPDQIRDFPMFVSPTIYGCEFYLKQVDEIRGEVRSATVGKTGRPLRLADFTKCSFDTKNLDATPMGRLADLTGGAKDKTRAHLAAAWCNERGLDGYERRNADELLIAHPRETLSDLETLSMEGFRSRYLETKKQERGPEARD